MTYGLSVYGAMDSDLRVIQNFLDGRLKRKLYTSKGIDIRDLLEKAIYAYCPQINSDRFKNVRSNIYVHYITDICFFYLRRDKDYY